MKRKRSSPQGRPDRVPPPPPPGQPPPPGKQAPTGKQAPPGGARDKHASPRSGPPRPARPERPEVEPPRAAADRHVFTVPPEGAKSTLAGALRQFLPGESWGNIRRLIHARRVLVNGNPAVDVGRRLKAGEVVTVLAQSAPPPPAENQVRIVYHDAHLAIVEKPSGLTSTRHHEEADWPQERKQFQPTLDEMLPKILARKGVKGSRRGGLPMIRAVHRLDRETSGLMVFARNVEAERILGEQFRKHTIHRRYVAVVHGDVEPQTIESRLIRDRGDGRRGSTEQPNVGKRAVTHVDVVERIGGEYTLVSCRLETGRTHQIRIHLSEAGHPVCGDRVYRKPPHQDVIPDRSGATRVALHATEIGVDHPETDEFIQFSAAPPRDFAELVERLRREVGRARPPRKRAAADGEIPPSVPPPGNDDEADDWAP